MMGAMSAWNVTLWAKQAAEESAETHTTAKVENNFIPPKYTQESNSSEQHNQVHRTTLRR